MMDGKHTSNSNANFDISLRSQNSAWGVRDLKEVTKEATENGFYQRDLIRMPANNISVVFCKV